MKKEPIDSDVHFRKLVEYSSSGITLLDTALNVIYRSPSTLRILGRDIDNKKRDELEDLIHPSDRAMLAGLILKVSSRPGIPKTCSVQVRHFKGHYIWLECTFTDLFDDEDVAAMVCNFRDISAQKKIELEGKEEVQRLKMLETERLKLQHDLKQIFDLAPDVICTVGIDGYFKKINPALCNLLEYTEEELLARPIVKIIHPDEQVKVMTQLEISNKGTSTFYFENRCITKTGKIKWLAWTSTPATEEGLVFTVAKDITEKKELEDLLYKVTTLAGIGGWDLDLVKNTIYWSDITKLIHEVGADYKPDFKTGILFYKDTAEQTSITGHIESAIRNCVSFDVEMQIITAKGNAKWVRVIGEPEFIAQKCIRMRGSFQDVTARKLNEDLLKDSEKRYSDLFQYSPLPKWVYDQETLVFLDVNEAALKQYGYTREEFLNMTIKDIRSEADVVMLNEVLKLNRKRKDFIKQGIFSHRTKTGKLIKVDIQSNPIIYKGRAAKVIIANDITERLDYIKAIEEQNAKLREISWMQSHVVRAPLARIMGLVELISTGQMEAYENAKMLEYLNSSANELDAAIVEITKKTRP